MHSHAFQNDPELRRRASRHGSLFSGGALVLAGVAFLLDRLGYLGGLSPWQFWPALLIWSGVLHLLGLHPRGGRAWGGILLVLGAAFQAHNLGLLPVHLGNLWPAGLIVLGIYVLLRGGRRRAWRGAACASTEQNLQRSVLFSGRQERVTSQRFQGGVIDCTLGGVQLDFTTAEIEGEEATLQVDVTMGGLELRVPRHWKVVFDASAVLGGAEDHTRFDDSVTPAKRLRITGRVLMGGVEIKN